MAPGHHYQEAELSCVVMQTVHCTTSGGANYLVISKIFFFLVRCPAFWEITIDVMKKLYLLLSAGSRLANYFCTVPRYTEGLHGWAALSVPSLIQPRRTAIYDYSYIL